MLLPHGVVRSVIFSSAPEVVLVFTVLSLLLDKWRQRNELKYPPGTGGESAAILPSCVTRQWCRSRDIIFTSESLWLDFGYFFEAMPMGWGSWAPKWHLCSSSRGLLLVVPRNVLSVVTALSSPVIPSSAPAGYQYLEGGGFQF